MIVVVGAGIFGATAALELAARGRDVTLLDPGPIPYPTAESTDLSKVVRCDYGADELYTELGERALDGWRRWNQRGPARYHETGVAFLSRAPLQPGGFEHDSFALLSRRGHTIERLDAAEIVRRFPALRPGALVDGYFHREGGWAEAANVVGDVVALARAAGVVVRPHARVTRVVDDGVLVGDELVRADDIVLCAGAWTSMLVPALSSAFRTVGQPVFHLAPAAPALFEAARLPVFGADISRTGYYGFPLVDGIVKIANHGAGVAMHPDDDRRVPPAMTAALEVHLRETFATSLAVVRSHLCVYCDTLDGHFWIDRAPTQSNVLVAAGGSGHAFKFAPVLGDLIADALDDVIPARFRARANVTQTFGDAARRDA